ncbi:heavy metal translocating P-type ATPase metal-binding domain-containing protein [Coraliomargarita parva]|uniref:heavy metal translocating P-type ATPase metal-binding domain-containing protein n=1 Tax=Coraliomargarita parva TaxID=3014050 RepID=UPI0022B48D1A|nr:heavy metal translocating P-type ATPase metal-binding domain-containing protein [Coraliomargarita parva]
MVPKIHCKHCGLPFPDGQGEGAYCCAGCAQVNKLIEADGLNEYYKLRDRGGRAVGSEVLDAVDWSWAQRLQVEAESGGGHSLVLRLEGMHCLGCIWLVERIGKTTTRLRAIKASLSLHQISVDWIPGEFDLAGFLQQLRLFGYEASAPGRRGFWQWSPLAWRALLCGIFAFNATLLELLAHYEPGDFTQSGLFVLLRLLFHLLCLLIGASYFAEPVLRSLRQGFWHPDTWQFLGLMMLALGSIPGLALLPLGLAGTVVLPLVLTLLLSGRLFQFRIWQRWGSVFGARSPEGGPVLLRQKRALAIAHLAFGLLLALGTGTVLFASGPVEAASVLVAGLLSLLLYPAELFIEEERGWGPFGLALWVNLCGLGLVLTGWFGVLAAGVWAAVSGTSVVWLVARLQAGPESVSH